VAAVERQSHTELVHAPLETCFDTIIDFARYPEWFNGISTAVVEQSDATQGRWRVKYQLNMLIKTISYTLEYVGRRPSELDWKLAAGDVRAVEGSYRFRSIDAEHTEATCTQAVDVGFWIPGPIRKTFERTALIDSVREFKKAAEQRARSLGRTQTV
jgi:ribosome-associated toxin RatA of RatAB toxin-antitoxin module